MSSPTPSPADRPRFRARSDLPARRLGGEVHVMGAAGEIHTLANDSAVVLWDALVAAGREGATAETLGRVLEDAFAVGPDRARADAAAFLDLLLERGLAEAVPRAPGPSARD